MLNSRPDWPPLLSFDQSKLQDWADCARRFQLRYILDQAWPAPVANPLTDLERADTLGKRFHLLIQRHYLGLPAAAIDPVLAEWWSAFLQDAPADLGPLRRPEVTTTAQLHGQRMRATFDLLAYTPNDPTRGVTIVDWKTNHKRPTRDRLDRRWQTMVYPLLLVESAERLLGFALAPEQVRLMYWFTATPSQPEIFQYSAARYAADRALLADQFAQMAQLSASVEQHQGIAASWPLTADAQRCRFCAYRSLCDRGTVAGSLDDLDANDASALTDALDHVDEIEITGDQYVL